MTSRERCPETRSPRLPTRKGSAPYFCHILRALPGTWPCPKCPLRRLVHAKMSSTPSQISSRPKHLRRRAVHAEGPNTPTGAFHRAGRRLAGRFGRDQMSTNPRVTCPQMATAPAMLHSDCPLISPPPEPGHGQVRTGEWGAREQARRPLPAPPRASGPMRAPTGRSRCRP